MIEEGGETEEFWKVLGGKNVYAQCTRRQVNHFLD